MNLLPEWPGSSGKGSLFPLVEAAEAAASLERSPELARSSVVLLCGKRVAAAFGEERRGYFEPFARCGRVWAVVPHPSGVNMWWNEPENREEWRRFLTGVKAYA